MKKITVEAGHLPELVVQPTHYNRIVSVLNKHKDGLTNHEITVITGITDRRVREATARLKVENKLKEKTCRCTRTPIYYL